MKRVSALLLTCTLGLSALSGCSASAAPQPLSAQPVTISEEEMMRYDLETPAGWSALSEFGLDPVSYTQLDVYKRQPSI